MAASLTHDLLAVELADALVAEGVPFRDAHASVGRLWALAEANGVEPAELPDAERLALSPHFTAQRLSSLDFDDALARRNHEPGTGPDSVAIQIAGHEARLGLGAGSVYVAGVALLREARGGAPRAATSTLLGEAMEGGDGDALAAGITIRRATLADVPGISAIMADYVIQGVLLARPVSELYQCVREFHVAEHRDGNGGEPRLVACAALRLLWKDLGEVRSLAVRPDFHGKGLGAALAKRTIDDARTLGLPRVIALTRELTFFERAGFTPASRDTLPRKVWTDCVRCPRRHACDEVAVVLDLVPGASEAAAAGGRAWTMPIPQPALPGESLLPIIS
jgi:amino-acid N-acetyltransferase